GPDCAKQFGPVRFQGVAPMRDAADHSLALIGNSHKPQPVCRASRHVLAMSQTGLSNGQCERHSAENGACRLTTD
ncbi:hypothetical protein, partial [Klebsiella aerogenes]|uniref:hypothetical protein n=1 Tax=Klebsiella aerogenes TaxID=548 RepID=UPI001954D427